MAESVTVSKSYRVVIPRDVREQAGIRPGQEFMMIVKHRIIQMVPVPTLDELQGMCRGLDYSGYREEPDA